MKRNYYHMGLIRNHHLDIENKERRKHMTTKDYKGNDLGKFTLLGYSPHCGYYAIDYVTDGGDKGWCYLKNCRYV